MDEDTFRAVDLRSKAFEDMTRGDIETSVEKLGPLTDVAAKDIARQRARLGGDWAAACVVYSRSKRQSLREMFGSDLVFIVLNISNGCLEKRLKARHGDLMDDDALSDLVAKFQEVFEPAEKEEDNAYNIFVTEDMNPADVVNKTLEIFKQL